MLRILNYHLLWLFYCTNWVGLCSKKSQLCVQDHSWIELELDFRSSYPKENTAVKSTHFGILIRNLSKLSYIKYNFKSAVVVHTCNPSNSEAETRESPWVLGQAGLNSETMSQNNKENQIKYRFKVRTSKIRKPGVFLFRESFSFFFWFVGLIVCLFRERIISFCNPYWPETHPETRTGLEFMAILLPLPSECLDHRDIPACPLPTHTSKSFSFFLSLSTMPL